MFLPIPTLYILAACQIITIVDIRDKSGSFEQAKYFME